MKNFKKIISKPQKILEGTLSIVFFSIISKALGFFREIILAANFGTSWRLDALIVAMDPAIKIGGVVSTAIASMMVPIFIAEKQKKDPEKIKAYSTQILFISSLFLISIGVLFSIFPGMFVKIFAPKFTGQEFEYAVRKMQIIGFLPLLQGFHSLANALLNAEKKFLLVSSIQMIFNLFTIPTIIIFSPFFNEASYLFAFIIGNLVIDFVLFYVLRKKIDLNNIRSSFRNPMVKETIILSLPLLLSGSLGVINGIVDKAFASSLNTGSISAIRYAKTMKTMISSIIISSLITTIFTELSETSSNKDKAALEKRIKKTSNDLLSFMIPLTFWLILMAKPLITLLYERGDFNTQSTNMVSLAFIGYSLTLIITPVATLLLKVFQAYKKTIITLMITIISVGLNFLLNWVLIKPLGILGLTLSTSFVALFRLVILNILQKKHFNIDFFNIKNTILISSSSILVFLFCFMIKNYLNNTSWLIISNLLFLIIFFFFNKNNFKRILRFISNIF